MNYEKTRATITAVRERRLAELAVRNANLVRSLTELRQQIVWSADDHEISRAEFEAMLARADVALAKDNAGYPELADA